LRFVNSDHFKIMAAAAETAREVLTRHWLAVNELSNHLLSVSWMSNKELTTFMKDHGVRRELKKRSGIHSLAA
jgi:hypothetical protein